MSETDWIEVSLTVNGELAEAVADVLGRYIPGGIVIETTALEYELNDTNKPTGPLRVCGYIPVDKDLEQTRHKIEEGLWYLGRIQPLPTPEFKPLENSNWVDEWKKNYKPLQVGEKFIILPPWYETPETNRIPILINPGMAFGTGTHPTTKLALQLAENWLKSGESVIDVGCGSGILSIGAVKLGASTVLGVDIDQDAVTNAAENLALNHIIESQVILKVGSVTNIREGQFPLQQATTVFANILAPILVKLLDQGLGDLISPGGHLILSGILADHLESIQSALDREKLKVVQQITGGDWYGLVVIPRDEEE